MPFYEAAFLQSLKDLHPIAKIAENLGLDLAVRRRAFCPKCQPNGGRTPDLTLYEDALYCFKCEWRPDVIALVQEMKGINFLDAVGWLSAAAPSSRASPRATKTRPNSGEPRLESRDYARLFRNAQAFAYRHENEIDDYLRTRGFSFASLKKHIGYLPEDKWAGRRGVRGRLVFPHFGFADARHIPNLYGRILDDKPFELRHDHCKGSRGFWSPTPHKARTSSHLALTEGVFDALGLCGLGSQIPVIAVFGVNGFRFEKFPMLKVLTLAFDKDVSGEKKAQELKALGETLGVKVNLLDEDVYDGHKDLGAAWAAQSSAG